MSSLAPECFGPVTWLASEAVWVRLRDLFGVLGNLQSDVLAAAEEWFNYNWNHLGCDHCKAHALKHLRRFPLHFSRPQELSESLRELYNSVQRRLNRPERSPEQWKSDQDAKFDSRLREFRIQYYVRDDPEGEEGDEPEEGEEDTPPLSRPERLLCTTAIVTLSPASSFPHPLTEPKMGEKGEEKGGRQHAIKKKEEKEEKEKELESVESGNRRTRSIEFDTDLFSSDSSTADLVPPTLKFPAWCVAAIVEQIWVNIWSFPDFPKHEEQIDMRSWISISVFWILLERSNINDIKEELKEISVASRSELAATFLTFWNHRLAMFTSFALVPPFPSVPSIVRHKTLEEVRGEQRCRELATRCNMLWRRLGDEGTDKGIEQQQEKEKEREKERERGKGEEEKREEETRTRTRTRTRTGTETGTGREQKQNAEQQQHEEKEMWETSQKESKQTKTNPPSDSMEERGKKKKGRRKGPEEEIVKAKDTDDLFQIFLPWIVSAILIALAILLKIFGF